MRATQVFLGLLGFTAWTPVFFLYFSSKLSVAQVLQLESIYYAAVVLLEVPSGVFSDRVGRRPTLLLASLFLSLAYGVFFVAQGFFELALAQVLMAGGFAFLSGTRNAFLFEVLEGEGRGASYLEEEQTLARVTFLAAGVASLGGGFSAQLLGLQWAYALSGTASLIALVLGLATLPNIKESTPNSTSPSLVSSLRSHPELVWLFGYWVLMVMLDHVPYLFLQPYADLLVGDTVGTPLVTGVLVALTSLVGYLATGFGKGGTPTLLLALGLHVVFLGLTSQVLHPILLVLFLARTLPKALYQPAALAMITPKIDPRFRATYLSLQNLAAKLGFSLLLLGLSFVGTTQTAHWPTLSSLLVCCLVVALIGGVALVALRPKSL